MESTSLKNYLAKEAPVCIAVYCTTQKKCVMIFANNVVCDRYLFGTVCYKPSSRTRYLIKVKGKTKKNVFNVELAFRVANDQHKEQLGNELQVILDDRFVKS